MSCSPRAPEGRRGVPVPCSPKIPGPKIPVLGKGSCGSVRKKNHVGGLRRRPVGSLRGSPRGAGGAGSRAQKSIVIFMIRAELDFILQYINWRSLLHGCITGFGKYEALFRFNANE